VKSKFFSSLNRTFGEGIARLLSNQAVSDDLLHLRLPAFSLQPIVENAIKYGISQLIELGRITISAQRQDDVLTIFFEDSAGLYQPRADGAARRALETARSFRQPLAR
jgi:LytS/YehU family sensor histidine kinase